MMPRLSRIVGALILLSVVAAFAGCGDGGDASTDSDAATADADDTGEFEIGTNTVNEANRDSFTLMTDGAEVPLVWGVQGSWMVVLSFRSQNLIEETFEVVADIAIDGDDVGEVWLTGQETFPGGDGWDYYYNLFLAIDLADPPPRGTPAHIRMSVTDEHGTTAEQAHDVVIGSAEGPE